MTVFLGVMVGCETACVPASVGATSQPAVVATALTAQMNPGDGDTAAAPVSENLNTTRDLTVLDIDQCFALAMEHNPDILTGALGRDIATENVLIARESYTPGFNASSRSNVSERTNPSERDDILTGSRSVSRTYTISVDQKLKSNGSVSLSTQIAKSEYESTTSGSEPADKKAFVGLNLSHPLRRGKGNFLADFDINTAKIDETIQQLSYRQAVQNIHFSVVTRYFAALKASKNIEVFRSHLASVEKMLEMARAKHDCGLGTKLDVSKNEVKVAEARARLIEKQNDYRNSLDSLFDTIGIPPVEPVQLADHVNRAPASLEGLDARHGAFDEKRLFQKARAQRFDLNIQNLRIEKQEMDVRKARDSLRAELNLKASYGKTGTTQHFKDSFDLNDRQWTLSLDSDLNSSKKANRLRYENALRELQQETIRMDELLRSARYEIARIIRSLKVSLERIGVLEKSLKQAEENLEYAQMSYEKGISTLISVLDARDDLREVRLTYISALIDFEIARKEIVKAVGD